MPCDLLLEIGTEEIPAGFLARGLGELERLAGERLAAVRLAPARVYTLGTPRRLALIAGGVPDRQPDVSERVVGPPARVAFDNSGAPTKAALGFARRNGVEVAALERAEVEGKSGEYVVCTRRERGRAAGEVIAAVLGELIAAIPWPKSMRWNNRDEAFVRPVHWIVALLADQVLPVSFAGVTAGRETRGHRFLAPDPVSLAGADAADYVEALRDRFVIAERELRRTTIAAELSRVERESGARVRADPALLEEVADLVEYPRAVCGQFRAEYLEVPEPVIVSAMRSHQRYFAMEDERGALVNRFVTIAGTVTRSADKVRHGNERVLAARLADAQFFFREDTKRPLAAWAKQLDSVVFEAKLGSMGAKVHRVEAAARALAGDVGADAAACARAAALCKADLATKMVGEFPDLEGVMGARYAREGGEPDEVARAIEEHYLPRGAGDRLPTGDAGAVVGIADRMDTVVGCFAAGLAPTGSADPYGLRRAALAVLAVLLDRGWTVPLSRLIDRAQAELAGTVDVGEPARRTVHEFFRTRLRGWLIDSAELPADCVDAALAAGFDDVPDARARAKAVAGMRRRPDFEPLAVAFKRVANILKGEQGGTAPVPEQFVEADERGLWDAFSSVRERVGAHLEDRDYHRALQVLAELKAPVDRFFDAVLVMDKDDRVRRNRLALLGAINATFTCIADFRQLAV